MDFRKQKRKEFRHDTSEKTGVGAGPRPFMRSSSLRLRWWKGPRGREHGPGELRSIPDPGARAATAPAVPLVPWGTDQVVEHLFFHPLVAYPELAFDGDSEANGIDDYMVTVDEYNKILQHCYDNNYILVNMNDVWSEYTTENGETRMRRNTLMLPEGKKPLVISYDDTNYYPYMLDNGLHLEAHPRGRRGDLELRKGSPGEGGHLPGSGCHHHFG